MWKLINDRYSISDCGQVRNNKTNRILKPDVNTKGYLMIRISNDTKHHLIHRLVAKAFIPNPLDLPQVNHIDLNKTNNHISNLEWISNINNAIHAYTAQGNNKNITTKEQYECVIQLTKEGKYPRDIVLLTGLNRNTIVAIRQGYNNKRFKFV